MPALFFLLMLPAIVGHLWMLALAFKESILWGIVCLFVPFATIIFGITHWQEAKKPLLLELSAVVSGVLAGILVPLLKKPEPVVKTETVAVTTTPATTTYTPIPDYTPPPPKRVPSTVTVAEPEVKMIEQVYVVNATNLYYSAKCKKHPENAYRLAKSIAVRQGFTEAPCP